MKATTRIHSLRLVHPFGISRGTTTESRVLFLQLEGGGTGEASVVRYYNQTVEEAETVVRKMVAGVTDDNLFDLDHHMRRAREIAPKASAARAAFDIALHDRIGRRLGLPLYRYFGYDRAVNAASSYTIGLDTDEKMVEKTLEAKDFPNLKIKLGRNEPGKDLAILKAIRAAAPGKTIRIDANAGWTLETALDFVRKAGEYNIEFVEQPLAIGNLEELAKLKKESPLPIIADEDVQDLASLPALLGKVDGINIKLMKCGGLWEARQMIGFARAVGWEIMLGCMIESGIAISAASHLAGAAQDLDLDSELLIANNPSQPGVLSRQGVITTPDGPGLGVELNLPAA